MSYSIKHPADHIFSIGESHAYYNFKDIREVTVKSIGSVTMHRVGRDQMDFSQYLIPDSIAFFCFGEIDVRMHIYKQVQTGRQEDEIIHTLVTKYIEAINKVKDLQCIPIIMSITPPNRSEPNPMVVGPNHDRSRYCKKLNDLLREKCAKNQIDFFDVYERYCDKEGMLVEDWADSEGYHIGKNHIVNEQFHILMESKGY